MEKLKIGLFIGGSSSEKEISLESGRHVYNNLDREKYEVLPIFVDGRHHFWEIPESLLWKNTTKDIEGSIDALSRLPLEASGKWGETENKDRSGAAECIWWEDLKELIDFAFICLHGKFGEDAILGLFEILSIPNNGASVLGGALSMDKYRQRLVLRADGIEVPRFVPISISEFRTPEQIESCKLKIENYLGYPFMVKPSREGSSTALHKVHNRQEIDGAFEDAFKFDNVILVEEVLKGMELTTAVYGIGNDVKALPPSQMYRHGDFLTAEEKFLPGGAQMVTPPPLPKELVEKIQAESIKTFRSLGLKVYSRIDSFLVGDSKTIEGSKVVILEPNNPPAMTPSTALWLQAAEAGLNASQFLDVIIKISLKAHSEKLGPL
ncbi:MAG: hypothetical protein M1352_02745 [Patescibacteria group bacterium]|nr:hypothetical protein [Patescibacteria group bacterium]